MIRRVAGLLVVLLLLSSLAAWSQYFGLGGGAGGTGTVTSSPVNQIARYTATGTIVAGATNALTDNTGICLGRVCTVPTNTLRVQDATAVTGATRMIVQAGAGQANTFLTEWQDTGGNTLVVINAGGALLYKPSSNVASADPLNLPGGNLFHVTGITTINTINACDSNNNGRVVVLIFDGVLTVTDGSNLKLAGNFVTTADDSLTLACDGTNWYEMDRSIN